jgi:peptidoglycan/xylan/chitin deacetylase (PgdA/CDA1 family)
MTSARRRRARRRWVAAGGALLLALAAAAAAFAAATGGGSSARRAATTHAATTHPAAAHPAPPVAPARTSRPATVPRVGAGRRADPVDRVLGYTQIVAGGVPRRQAIALTFDDGPSPYTTQVLRVLARSHVPATFFIVGQQLAYFAAGLRAELRQGMEVGDHTQNHAWLIRLGEAQQYAQIDAVRRAVRRLGGPTPRLFRPPYGLYDAATLSVLRGLRMLGVLWSVDPGDWRRPGTAAIVRSVLFAARPGAIVELHDGGGNRSQTVAALPAIIDGLHRRHYRFLTVSQLLAVDPPARHQRLPSVGAA